MGGDHSKLKADLIADPHDTEKYFGLENYDNTCYCNSVLQALYFCIPFRRHILAYHHALAQSQEAGAEGPEDTLMWQLAKLFANIAGQRKQTGVIGPKQFVRKLREENIMFEGDDHQDAHEFLNYLLNELVTTLQKEAAPSPDTPLSELGKIKTWVHDVFEGSLTNQTRCMCCEEVTNRTEPFLDLSIDVEDHSSITACLNKFSSTEMLDGRDKFFCDKCASLQEAEKRMLVKKLPHVLTVHLKRFKYFEQVQGYRKLSCRVVFPFELRLPNTSQDCEDEDRVYSLFAIVVHAGNGMNHGHYVCIVKSQDRWLMFDDERVLPIDHQDVQSLSFGSISKRTDVGYILFYQSAMEGVVMPEIPTPEPDPVPTPSSVNTTARSTMSDAQSTTSTVSSRSKFPKLRNRTQTTRGKVKDVAAG